MKQSDIGRIEQELGVKLPRNYAGFFRAYPKDLNGKTAKKCLIGDPDRLLQFNRHVRTYYKRHRSKMKPWEWPNHWFALGESDISNVNEYLEEEKSCYAIDVREKDPKVMNISIVSGAGTDDVIWGNYTLREFVAFIRDMDGVDEKPNKPQKKRLKRVKSGQTAKKKLAKADRSPSAQEVFALAGTPKFAKLFREWLQSRFDGCKKYEKLSEGEKLLWRLRYASWEIQSNGVLGIFESNTDDFPFQMLNDLVRIGAKRSASALTRVGRKVFARQVPRKLSRRTEVMFRLFETDEDRLERVNRDCGKIWDEASSEIPDQCVAFAARHPELFGLK